MHLQGTENLYELKLERQIQIPLVCVCGLFFFYLIKQIYVITQNESILYIIDCLEWPLYILAFVSSMILAKFSTREFLGIALACVIFGITYLVSGYAELLKSALLVISMRRVDFRLLLKVMFSVLIVSILLTLFLYLLGVSDAGIQRRGASSIGYAYPNTVGFVLMMLTFFWINLRKRICFGDYLALLSINLLGYIISDGRSAFALSVVILFATSKKMLELIRRCRWIQKVLVLMPVLCCVFTFVTAVLYPRSKIVQTLDPIFTSRIWMNYYIFENHEITLFGQWIQSWLVTDVAIDPVRNGWYRFMTADNVYTCLLTQMGIVSTLTVFVVYGKLVRRLFDRGWYAPVVVMTFLSIYGIVESSVLSVYVCYPFLALFANLQQLKNGKNRKGCVEV